MEIGILGVNVTNFKKLSKPMQEQIEQLKRDFDYLNDNVTKKIFELDQLALDIKKFIYNQSQINEIIRKKLEL